MDRNRPSSDDYDCAIVGGGPAGLTAAIYLAVPSLLWGGEWLAGRRNARLVATLHQSSVGGLVFLFCMLVGRQWSSSPSWLMNSGFQGTVIVASAAALAAVVARCLPRRGVQQLLLVGACGSVLFPIQFVRTGAAASVLTPPGPPLDVRAGRPAPVGAALPRGRPPPACGDPALRRVAAGASRDERPAGRCGAHSRATNEPPTHTGPDSRL